MIVSTTPNDMQYFTSDQLNAPQMMGNSNGDMLSVLDACLLTGWGSQLVMNATLIDNVITLEFGLSHGFLQGQLISVAGFTDSALDGIYRIKVLTPNSVSIKAPSALDAGGVLTAKLAPLGWESLFGSAEPLKRAYRSLSAKPSNKVLFLDMTYPNPAGYHGSLPAKRAMVTVCNDMQVIGVPIGDLTSNINNKATNVDGSLFWYQKREDSKNLAVSNSASKWRIVGNGDVFYFLVGWSSVNGFDGTLRTDMFGFGRFAEVASDPVDDNHFLSAVFNKNDTATQFFTGSVGSAAISPIYIFNNLGEAVLATRTVLKGSAAKSGRTVPYPNRYGNAVFATPYRIYIGNELRGFLYGAMFLDSAVDTETYDSRLIDDLLILGANSLSSSSASDSLSSQAFYVGS